MIAALFALAALAQGDALVAQRALVEQAAEAVAAARARGARRTEVAALMAEYRRSADRLEALSVAHRAPVEDLVARRHAARLEVLDALAEGRRAPDARAELGGWLGDPTRRSEILEAALAGADPALPAELRTGVLLDVLEQADGLVAMIAYDAAQSEREAGALALRAEALRRQGFGQGPDMAAEVEAVRLEAEVKVLEEVREALLVRREAARALRARAAEEVGR